MVTYKLVYTEPIKHHLLEGAAAGRDMGWVAWGQGKVLVREGGAPRWQHLPHHPPGAFPEQEGEELGGALGAAKQAYGQTYHVTPCHTTMLYN